MPVIPGDPMSPMAGPELLVNPPPLEAEPAGLLTTLQVMDEGSDRFIGGIRHRPENFQPILGLDPCANTVVTPVYSGLPPRVGRSFVAQVTEECGSWGWRANDYEGRATRGLLARESIFVERELEQAVTVPENPHLAMPGTFAPTTSLSWANGANLISDSGNGFRAYMEGWVLSGQADFPAGTKIEQVLSDSQVLVSEIATAAGAAAGGTFTDPGFVLCAGGQAVSPLLALAYLNQAIADAHLGMGMIHCSAFVGERWFEARGVTGASGPTKFFSVNGNPVVMGNGYAGVGPDSPQTGGSPTTVAPSGNPVQWAYATDLMQVVRAPQVRLYPDSLAAAMQRDQNLVAYRASRPFAINWSGLLRAAVKVAVTS